MRRWVASAPITQWKTEEERREAAETDPGQQRKPTKPKGKGAGKGKPFKKKSGKSKEN